MQVADGQRGGDRIAALLKILIGGGSGRRTGWSRTLRRAAASKRVVEHSCLRHGGQRQAQGARGKSDKVVFEQVVFHRLSVWDCRKTLSFRRQSYNPGCPRIFANKFEKSVLR